MNSLRNGAGCPVFKISGELDHHTAGDVKDKLDRAILSSGARDIVLDFKNLRFMDSSGIGVLLGRGMVYRRISGKDNLKFFARMYGVRRVEERIEELAQWLKLEDRIDSLVETYSLGMRSKLGLARSMIHDPDVLFFDEPTLGLDPQISSDVRQKIRQLQEEGKTVLLCTHYMAEAEQMYPSER